MGKKFALGLIIGVTMSFMVGCGNNNTANTNLEASQAMGQVVSSEMSLSEELQRRQLTTAIVTGEEFDISELDCISLAQTMEKYDDLLKYNNLYTWMCMSGLYEPVESFDETTSSISDTDYEKMINTFYELNDDEKNQVLQQMFKATGMYVNQDLTLEFDYVPTGETTDDGTELTTYEATNTKTVSTEIYAYTPLEIEYK